MKKKLTMILLLAGVSLAPAWAQDKGQSRLLASVALGTESALSESTSTGYKPGIGLTLGGDYFIIDKLSFSPTYTFFFPSSLGDIGSGGEVKFQSASFNIDAKYFLLTKGLNVYALAGVSFASGKTTISSALTGENTFKKSYTGGNFGAGLDIGLGDKLYFNGQVKYNTSLDQLVVNAGVGFKIN